MREIIDQQNNLHFETNRTTLFRDSHGNQSLIFLVTYPHLPPQKKPTFQGLPCQPWNCGHPTRNAEEGGRVEAAA